MKPQYTKHKFTVNVKAPDKVCVWYHVHCPHVVGPKQKTVPSFWNMVWQERVHCIVMATGLFENANVSIHQFLDIYKTIIPPNQFWFYLEMMDLEYF